MERSGSCPQRQAAPPRGNTPQIRFRDPIRLDTTDLVATNLLSCAMARKPPLHCRASRATKLLWAARLALPHAQPAVAALREDLSKPRLLRIFLRFLDYV